MKSFKSKSWIIAIICNLFFPEISIAQIKIMDEQFIFDSASFPSCHASTIVELKNGDILTAWFGGTAEGNDDVAIWSSVKSKATGWSVPRVLIKEPGASMYNPVLFYTLDAVLWLYYKYGKSPMTWSAGKMYSVDNGKTWSDPIHLPAGLYGPIRAKPLVLTDGTIVSGTSVEMCIRDSPEIMQAALEENKRLGLRSACHHAQMDVARWNVVNSARAGLTSCLLYTSRCV